MSTSNVRPSCPSRSASATSKRAVTPRSAALSLALAMACGEMSTPIASAPRAAASSTFSPVPQPESSSRPDSRPRSASRTNAGCGLPMSHGGGAASGAYTESQLGGVVMMHLAHRVVAEAHGVLDAGAKAGEAGQVPEELVGIEIAAQPFEVGTVLAQRGDARVDGGGDVHEMGRVRGSDVRAADAGPVRPCVGEHPLVGRVPARVEHGEPDRTVIGVVDGAFLAP